MKRAPALVLKAPSLKGHYIYQDVDGQPSYAFQTEDGRFAHNEWSVTSHPVTWLNGLLKENAYHVFPPIAMVSVEPTTRNGYRRWLAVFIEDIYNYPQLLMPEGVR